MAVERNINRCQIKREKEVAIIYSNNSENIMEIFVAEFWVQKVFWPYRHKIMDMIYGLYRANKLLPRNVCENAPKCRIT